MSDMVVTYLRPKASNLSSVAACTATEVLFERQVLQRPISVVVEELLEGSKATSAPSKGDAILESPL